MTVKARYAIITPYYKESRALIERCIDSVRRQTVQTDHFVVADGFPQPWIDAAGVRHFKLDRGHGDFGNTPRGVGALMAIGEEYSGIGMLDADNWLEDDHVEACLAAAKASGTTCDYVIAKRTFRRPNETIMPVPEEPDHVDTNCFFFLRGSFSVIPHWAMMPNNLAPLCDRYFFAMIRQRSLIAARVSRPTVNYYCLWEALYRSIGETPPPEAKPSIDGDKVQRWLASLDRRDLDIASRLTGMSLATSSSTRSQPTEAKLPRNAECHCGSGKRFKHCHGQRI